MNLRRMSLPMLAMLVAFNSYAAEEIDRFEATVTKQVKSHYLVVKPEGYDPNREYPLLIFLHGKGEQGDDLKLLKFHGPYDMVKKLGLDLIIVAPQSPLDQRWDIDMLDAFVDDVLEKYPIDTSRVYLTGLSMGGEGAWYLAIRRPETFAALAPICGVGAPSQASRISDIPTWAFHGDKDPVVPLKKTTDMVDSLKAAGGNVRLTIYEGVGHNSWKPAFEDPKFYQWLMSQSNSK